MAYTIYLVEDDVNLNSVLYSYLQKEGWEVSSFITGKTAQKAISTNPHLWIIDIMLPDIDGYQLIREIKTQTPDVPVIFISARDADIDRVIGLELGSDDYLPKPFLPRELVIRSKKLLERIYNSSKEQTAPPFTLVPPYQINEANRTALLDGKKVDLTSKEFDLLLYFLKNRGQALSREQILYHIWGDDYFGSDRVVDDLVRRLRKKMPDLGIETIYGYGYRMVK
ncbi:MAG: response regulator transcription factor [Bacillota bacterium]